MFLLTFCKKFKGNITHGSGSRNPNKYPKFKHQSYRHIKDGVKFSFNIMCVLDVSAEVILKNDSVRKLAELEGLQSLDLSGDSVTSTGQ